MASLSSQLLVGWISGAGLSELAKGVSWVMKSLLKKYRISGIVAPPGSGKSYCLKHLKGDAVVFIDLDDALKKDGIEMNGSAVSSGIDRKFYNKAQEHFEDILNITDSTSKSSKDVVIFSRDYKLLKFLGVEHIKYFIQSQAFLDTIKKCEPDFYAKIENDILAYRAKLIDGKKFDKTIVLNSKEDLLSYCSKLYNCEQKC